MDIIKSIEHEQLKSKIPDLKVGNTVKVHARIKEGNKERIQVFEGTIIKVQGSGVNKTFTVRKISYGVGVEKTFLVHSPLVEKVELVRVGKARRAKLFYLRDRVGKSAKTREVVGARIENKEIVVKGDDTEVVEEPKEAPVEEVKAPEVSEEKAAAVEAPVVEDKEAPKAEETVKEEAKSTKTEETVKEEAKSSEKEVKEEKAPKAEEAVKEETKASETEKADK